jgi:ATP-binding cassette subfamily B protein
MVTVTETGLMLGKMPEAVRPGAEAAGLKQTDCLFSLRSDIDLNGRLADVWLVVTETGAAALSTDSPGGQLLSGPLTFKDVQKVRMLQTVGSAFLQFKVGGLYVDVVRVSNAEREFFHRARVQIERLVRGQPFQREHLTRPSEQTCPACGLPLPSRGGTCRRCQARHGILLRSLELMTPYKPFIALLLALMVVRVAVSLVPPYLVRLLVDGVLRPAPDGGGYANPGGLLLWFVLGLLVLHAVTAVLSVSIGRVSATVGTRITKDMREMLQTKLVKLDVAYYDQHSVGSLMSRVLYDTEYFQGFVDQVAGGFLLNLMTVLAIGVMLFVLNWHLALLVLLPVPLVVVGTVIFWKHVHPLYYPVWDSQSKMSQLLSGVLSGIRLVKAFGQEHREEERFGQSAQRLLVARRKLQYSVATFNPLMAFVFGLGGLIIWYAGGRLVLENSASEGAGISLGVLMAFFSYVAMFYGPIQMLSQFANWMTGFVSAGQRIFEILDADVQLPASKSPVPAPDLRGEIEFRNVTFGYDPHSPVLKDVSMQIEPGQFIGIVGKSGSGKTTLVNLICRFYDVQQGQLLIDGTDVRDISQDDLHGQVALVLQEPFLFRASITDNIVYAQPDATVRQVVDAAKAANAHDFIARMPAAYDRKVGERGAGLSGGERQRVTIARALIRSPKILILDEATSSVDTESEQEIQRALSVLGRGRTTIVIAHRLSTLKNADRIYLMDDGQIAESGTHEELVAQGGLYYKLVRAQTELARLELD